MRRKYKILEHTADLKIKVFGRTKKELFKNAMIGFFEGGRYSAKYSSCKKKIKIKISSLDLSSLLVDFLSEILYLVETKKLVFCNILFEKFSENKIEATLFGFPLKRIGLNIKGVTYHGLEIKQKKNGWEATILFDI